MSDEKFILEYEKLLDKGYCDCNEMNCIDNDSPRRILRIAKNLQQENKELKEKLDCDLKWAFKCDELTKENQKLKKEIEKIIAVADTNSELADKFYNKIQKSKEMQREFIEWLEGEIKTVEDKIVKYDELLMNGKETDIDYYESMINKGMSDACKEVLSKYKSIIGSDKSE